MQKAFTCTQVTYFTILLNLRKMLAKLSQISFDTECLAGCKESQFYRSPFGQAATSMYQPKSSMQKVVSNSLGLVNPVK